MHAGKTVPPVFGSMHVTYLGQGLPALLRLALEGLELGLEVDCK